MKTITASTLLLGPLIFAASTLAVPQNLAALNLPALGGVPSTSSSTSMHPKSTHYNEKPSPDRTETSTMMVYASASPTYQAQAQSAAAAPQETQWMQQSGASSAMMPPMYQVVNASTTTMGMGTNMTGMTNMTQSANAMNGAASLAWNNKVSLLSGAAVAGGFLFLV